MTTGCLDLLVSSYAKSFARLQSVCTARCSSQHHPKLQVDMGGPKTLQHNDLSLVAGHRKPCDMHHMHLRSPARAKVGSSNTRNKFDPKQQWGDYSILSDGSISFGDTKKTRTAALEIEVRTIAELLSCSFMFIPVVQDPDGSSHHWPLIK